MVIGISTVLLSNAFFEQYHQAISNSICNLAKQLPQHQLVLFCNSNQQSALNIPHQNCAIKKAVGQIKTRIKKQFWLKYTLPKMAKKEQINCLINYDGHSIASNQIVQLLYIVDNSFLYKPNPGKNFQFKNILANSQKIKHCFTTSSADSIKLQEFQVIAENKTTVLQLEISEAFKPLNRHQQFATRDLYSNDENYFLFIDHVCENYDIIQLLKAFSIFKKWQKSNIKLILYSAQLQHDKQFLTQLNSYKFKNDVILLSQKQHVPLPELIASAYAVVLPNSTHFFPYEALAAVQCNVPVIISTTTFTQSVLQNAALFLSDSTIATLANQMQIIFKDEILRNQLIENGKLLCTNIGKQQEFQTLIALLSIDVEKN
jgi:glycosyltransferase involved in cell wall biosynthesis